jgi:cobalamin biosynthesis protein CobT
MSSNLVGTKSILAKLLAGENINVVHQNGISTASFDLSARTMYLPVWENMDGDLYDMLVGHENGHALYTPAEGWHNAIDERGRKFKSCMNVIEDARIEKLIKRKYPGLAKSFANAYRDLFDRDFFGIRKLKDISKLNLIDRINVHCKLGAHIIVPFTDEERDIVREVERAETWDQVMDLSIRVFDYAKKEESDKINNLDDLTEKLLEQFKDELDFSDEEFDDFSDDSEEPNDAEDASESGEESSKSEDGEESDTDGEDGEDGDGDSKSDDNERSRGKRGGTNRDDEEKDDEEDYDSKDSDEDEDEPESITDRVFRNREKELVVGDVEIRSYTLPTPILENIVIPLSAVVKQFFIAYNDSNGGRYPIAETALKRFNETNSKFINMLVKEFEMRKNAAQYARTQTARTGELDMSKLHLYKFSNDLFKKVSVVPKGKNHGLLIFVDMSGSMGEVFGATIEQSLILASFCKKVGIPFDVYGFSDESDSIHHMISDGTLPNNFGLGGKFRKSGTDNYTIDEKGFHLRQLISSNASRNEYRKAQEMLATVAYNFTNRYYATHHLDWNRAGFGLHSTPFSQTTLASRPLIEKFKSKYHLDVVNVIYLTDGEGGNIFNFNRNHDYSDPNWHKKKFKVIMTDAKTKQRVEFDGEWGNQQSRITQFVAEITGCKHIGYYICSSRDCNAKLRDASMFSDGKQIDAAVKTYREYKYFSVPHLGYHRYFYIAMPKATVKDDDYEITDKMTARRIARVFSNAQEAKRKNRMLISQFTQEIAA